MARKLIFTVTLLVLATVLTAASFANNVPTLIVFGPNTTGTVTVGPNHANFPASNPTKHTLEVSGWAQQGGALGTFALSGAAVTIATGHAPILAPNAQLFTVDIGSDKLAGWLSLDTMIDVGKYGTFFGGTYDITGSTLGFAETGFPVGAQVLVDFTIQRNGTLSSGEIVPDSAVPEPGTIAMVGSGLLMAAGLLRRKL